MEVKGGEPLRRVDWLRSRLEKTLSSFPFFKMWRTTLLVLDSGATSHLVKDQRLFIYIDKKYFGTVINANSSKSIINV